MKKLQVSAKLIKELYLCGCDVKTNELMSKHTSFGIGGNIDFYITPTDVFSFKKMISVLNKSNIKRKFIGNGTNILVDDNENTNFDFVVIDTKLVNEMSIKNETTISVGSGVDLRKFVAFSAEYDLSGTESLCGIPGTIGGALYMNAGAYGGNISDCLTQVCVYDIATEEEIIFTKDECDFSYRSSIFKNRDLVILNAEFEFIRSEKSIITEKILEFDSLRIQKQPVNFRSAGSVFKKPKDNFYVGKIIEKLGLKGTRIGDAMISEKHAGFIVNIGKAKFKDVLRLITLIKNKVYQETDIILEIEIEIWGK